MTLESGENIITYTDKENVDDIKGKEVEICDVDFKYIGNFVKKIDGKYTDFYFELLPDIVFTTDDEALTNHIVNQSEEVDQNAKFVD